jgi:predicted LPLAT superfamily acyltransferase
MSDVTAAPRQWQTRPEAGGRVGKWLMRMLAFGAGRPICRFIIFFVALYFMIRRGPERAASRVYLQRVLGRRATLLDVYRHFLSFSTVTMDRLYLMADHFARFDVRISGIDQLDAALSL